MDTIFLEVMESIKEHSQMDDFEQHCQKILKANCGMNVDGFLDMIENSVQIRISRCSIRPKNEDLESLECFLHVLDKCASSSMAGNSIEKIQKLKNIVSKILSIKGNSY